jgi:hypothetical protein
MYSETTLNLAFHLDHDLAGGTSLQGCPCARAGCVITQGPQVYRALKILVIYMYINNKIY